MVVGGTESQDANKKLISNILIVKAVAEEVTIDILRGVFNTASDIIIPQNQKPGKRLVLLISSNSLEHFPVELKVSLIRC